MKKILTMIFLIVLCLTANAQGIWSTGMLEADELKGTVGGPFYRYEVKGDGGFVLWDWNKADFKIFTSKGNFDVWYYTNSGYRFTSITIGLYTLDGKLKSKLDQRMAADQTCKEAWINKQDLDIPRRNKIKRMLKALKTGDGYVRIISARKGAEDFDIKIMPYDLK